VSGSFLRVPRPRLLGLRRASPHEPAAGDEALVEAQPGLAGLLALRDAEGRRLGEGLGHEWWIALGAAATAAVCAGGEERGWVGISASVDWVRASQEQETLRARASVEQVAANRFGLKAVTYAFEVVGGDRRDVVVSGKLVMGTARTDATGLSTAGTRADGAAGSPVVAARKPLRLRVRELAAALLPPLVYGGLRRLYRRSLRSTARQAPSVLRWVRAPETLAVGGTSAFELEVRNDGSSPSSLEAVLEAPFGFGLTAEWTSPHLLQLRRGESARLSGLVRALRPDEVNLGRPWPLVCVLKSDGRELRRQETSVHVPDGAPGRVFYVLTEDCETFDGGPKTGDYGPLSVLGNANDFMDPEEYRVQMIEKPAALNRIADKHGARFTHFWTTPQLSAAEWACGQSASGAWPEIVRKMRESVRSGAVRHEYAPHVHFDYEPDSRLPPQPRLSYDPTTDGLLPVDYYDPVSNPDHKYHGWDGARKGIAYVKREGDLQDTDSKTGSLRKATRLLARLSLEQRQSLLTRTGACDLGSSPEDLAASFRALEANGLLANADAGVYQHFAADPRGRQVYFCKRSDLEAEIETLEEASLVQLRAPEFQLEGAALGQLNAWFDRRMAQSGGPGVRAIVAMTHAMFMKGAPDPFRDTSGGDFDKLDRHLDHVRRTHPGVRFATASEAVLEFLDYYSPVPRAVISAPAGRSDDGQAWLYPIRILGRGIPLSSNQPMTLVVLAPLAFDPEELQALTVLEDGVPVASASPAGPTLARLEFQARRRDGYLLAVRTKAPPAGRGVARAVDAEAPGFLGGGEDAIADLLRIEPPRLTRKVAAKESAASAGDSWDWAFPAELFRLLVSPVAGRGDPLARRLHPYGWAPLGMVIHACRQALPGLAPRHAELRWLKPLTGSTDFLLQLRLERVDGSRATLQGQFFEATVPIAQMRITRETSEA
jgi:hypothetical protein